MRQYAIILLLQILFFNCESKKKPTLSLKKSSEAITTDLVVQVEQDSVKRTTDEEEVYLDKPWKSGTFSNEYGEPTNEKFIKTSAEGYFLNSAVSEGYLYAEVLLEKSAAGIFLHEYKATNPPEKIIGTAKIKIKNSSGEELEIVSSSAWNQNGGILIKNFTMVKGAESYDFSNFKNFLKKSPGKIKVVIYDKYSSTYRFDINADGFTKEYSLLQ